MMKWSSRILLRELSRSRKSKQKTLALFQSKRFKPCYQRRNKSKYIQHQLGHASIQITMDRYGHLKDYKFKYQCHTVSLIVDEKTNILIGLKM